MNKKISLLIIEDDPNLGLLLNEYLSIKGFKTELACDGLEGEQMIRTGTYDFLIMDIMMPKKDGFTLMKELRQAGIHIPALFLTAKTLREDVLHGLSIGADDYMQKPFSMEELVLRIHAILRRYSGKLNVIKDKIRVGRFELTPVNRILEFEKSKKQLTEKECNLLQMLIRYENQVMSRKTALMEIWGDDSYFNSRSMDVYVNKLRKHLKPDPNLQILTVHGQGFKLVNLV